MSSRRLRSKAEITRTRIESIIQSQPGIRFGELVRMTQLAHGTLSHKIKIHERQRRVRIRRDRGSTHIFPKSYDDKLCIAMVYTRHPTTMAIIALLLANERCNCHQIKKAVMRSSSTICEHLKRLSLAGLVSRRVAKRSWVYGITM